MGKKGGGFLTTLVLALVIVVLSVGIGVGISRFNFAERMPLIGPLLQERPAQTETSPVVVEGVRGLDRLATVRVTESIIVTRESGGDFFERLFSGERVLLVASGDVEAGVDLADLGENDVVVREDTATIRLPEPEVLSASLDEENTRVYDRDYSPLNVRPDDDLVEEARATAEERLEAAARENGILETAETNAEQSIRAFVETLGFEEVRFE
ncbi:MAG: hypothetical protein AVDCRST_MAG03-224 [uncultured Rubrobacteraceae bacterium]|uniref:DUF4230 domain-containing protein n=1 Tax=uncultured Rubrobacteraceae bacterium TaxID=349277 RepID=A0A6J4NKB0_9ACTN|nr:MAG: hypothetical protein AVDCRST_MAG03-224 [uncultured Rubrobacteraceae bacterium]